MVEEVNAVNYCDVDKITTIVALDCRGNLFIQTLHDQRPDLLQVQGPRNSRTDHLKQT